MAFKTMFNPKAFSPQTVLSQDVGTSDTRLYVDDVLVFPAVPTLATIGADSSTAETVRVTAIGSNFIDVERGYVGSAKAFTANTVIARNFSSADQQIIQDNITYLNDAKLEEVATDDIVDNVVTNAKLAQVATSTIKGRRSPGVGAVEDLTVTQVRELINVSDGADKTSSVIEAATNVTIADDDAVVIIDASASAGNKTKSVLWSAIKAIFAALYVPLTRTVNSKALSSDISLSASDVGADASGTASTAVSNHNSSSSAHSAQFGNKQDNITVSGMLKGTGESVVAAQRGVDYVHPDDVGDLVGPTTATALPASGTALTANTIYAVADAVGTYAFTPPDTGWAHGMFTTGSSVSVSFAGTFMGAAPTVEASKAYEFDVYDGVWAVQEVVSA